MHHDASTSRPHGEQPWAELADGPSPEALFAIRAAGDVARRLHESGQELRFSLVPDRDRVCALLYDADGTVLSRLTPARVLDIASGAPMFEGSR